MPHRSQCPACGGTLIKHGCCSWECLDCNKIFGKREMDDYERRDMTYTKSIDHTVNAVTSTIAEDDS